jgi:hypothetical protein
MRGDSPAWDGALTIPCGEAAIAGSPGDTGGEGNMAELTLFTVLSIDFKTGAAAFSFFMCKDKKD